MISGYKIYFLLIIYSVGIAGHLIPSSRGLMLSLTPYVLLITGIVTLSELFNDKKFINWLLMVYAITFLLEVIGVKTGKVFGEYSYGEVLGYKLFDVPVIIGLNWAIVIAGTIGISDLLFSNKILKILNTGLLAVLFDYFLEPLAIYLDYWNWKGTEVPLQNYLAWFIISVLAATIFYLFKIKLKSTILIWYFIIQFIFFTTLTIILT